ncbi:MAG: nuclease-related domain-containing protein [Peptococcaceae bacterium]|nr:nuclease-related domain-containing protein [Peptococcaceae bacterium]
MAQTLKWPTSLKEQIYGERHRTGSVGRAVTLVVWVVFGGLSIYLIQRGLIVLALICWVVMLVSLAGLIPGGNPGLEAGQTGEETVAEELDSLPDGWFIINDVVVGGLQIDHIAVGPAGLFCIETKNWNNAGCDGNGNWYRFHRGMWVAVPDSPARQNMRHVMALKDRLGAGGIRVHVNSVVVFSGVDGKYEIRARRIPPGDTAICFTPELKRKLLDTRCSAPLSRSLIERITRRIMA